MNLDPQLKSTLTTILAAVLGGAGVWAVKVGVVPVSDQANFVNMLVTVVIGGAGAALTWYKARQQSPTGLVAAVKATGSTAIINAVAEADPRIVIAAVNNPPNGLKVVASSVLGDVETAPLK